MYKYSKQDDDDDFNNDNDDDDTRNDEKRMNIIDKAIDFQIQLLNDSQKKYIFLQKIEKGSKNSIFFCASRPNKKQSNEKQKCYAIKSYPYKTKSEIDRVNNELLIVSLFFQDPAIIKYHDNFIAYFEHKFVVMAYYEKLDLMEAACRIINGRKEFVSFEENDIRQIAYQGLKILKLLKQKNIVHNDIKLENILVASVNPIVIILSDFENAECISDQLSQNHEGKPYIQAPEVLEHKPHGVAADMWSFGIVLYGLLTNSFPYYIQPFMDESQVIDNITNLELDQQDIPGVIYQLISRMLILNPDERISVEEALQSEWFDGIEEINLLNYVDLPHANDLENDIMEANSL